MTTDLLEQRLRELVVPAPDAGRLAARALDGRSSRRRLPRAPRFALASVAAVVLAALIAYFVPAADTALARVPFAGDALADAGLVGATDRISWVGSSATSSGYTVTLVGAYADSTRTVFLLNCRPACDTSGPHVVLTDQFGRAYYGENGSADLLTGANVMQFDPLAWPISVTGARVTLQLSAVETSGDIRTGEVEGSWTLHATLGFDEGTSIALPDPATLGSAHFTFDSVTYTPASVAIEMTVRGVTFEDLGRVEPNGLKGAPAFQLEIRDPSGADVTGASSMNDDWLGVVHIRALAYRTEAGAYTLRVTYLGGSFERTLIVR